MDCAPERISRELLEGAPGPVAVVAFEQALVFGDPKGLCRLQASADELGGLNRSRKRTRHNMSDRNILQKLSNRRRLSDADVIKVNTR